MFLLDDKTVSIFKESKRVLSVWKECHGWAPNSAAIKMDNAMLEWMDSLTDCLSIWNEKGNDMTEGELILAYANLGDLVECWLKFFLCLYEEDYCKNPLVNKKGRIEPEKISFESIKQYFKKNIWKEENDIFDFIDNVQLRRNAIHSFNYRELGIAKDYLYELEKYGIFLSNLFRCLPPEPEYDFNF